MPLRVRFIAHGAVQGVGFRSFACRLGENLSLVGFAKNLLDDTVEIVAEGEEEKLAQFSAKLCSMRHPFGITVNKLEEISREKIPKVSFPSFSVGY